MKHIFHKVGSRERVAGSYRLPAIGYWLLAIGCWLLFSPFTLFAQSHSVLSTGRWWKVDVKEEGVYRITTVEIPALAGARVDSVAVYGRGGGMLPLFNGDTPIGDLPQVATEVRDENGNGVFDAGDELLFFGEGAEVWRYDYSLRRWAFEHHAYATKNCYYVTASCGAPKRVESGEWRVESDTTVNTYTEVTHVDNDLVNLFHSGQVWVGENLSAAVPTRRFELHVPGTGIHNVRVRWAVVSNGTSTGRFTLSTEGYSGEITTSSSNPYRTAYGQLTEMQNSYPFTLSFAPSDNMGSGYLDFIEVCADVTLTWNGGQKIVRSVEPGGRVARYELGVGSGEWRVWEVTKAGEERELAVGRWPLADGSWGWTDSTGGARRYVLFDSYSYLTPEAVSEIGNQDLHGSGAAELVIVTHGAFEAQARRLAMMHELMDGLSTLVVRDEEVYNEFSSGKQDPMAVRALLRWMKRRVESGEWREERAPRYLLLFGKGTYDNRHLEQGAGSGERGAGSEMTTVVTYETPYSFDDDGGSYGSDDMLGYLDSNEYGGYAEKLDVSVGRLPAKSVEEAELMVDKLEGYMTRRDLEDERQRGDWRNIVALLADDADPGHTGDTVFAHSSEVIATSLKQTLPELNIDRLYADAYHQESGAIGSYYPDLNNALRQRMDYGCLLINYIGHGSVTYIGTERYIELANVASYSNVDRLPLFVTSTCSYGRYDETEELSGSEACLLAPAAAIGVISASRPISHVERFNKDVVLYALERGNTIGDALRRAKNRTAVSPCIGLIGDPALRLSRPANRVKVTHINEVAVEESGDVEADVLSRVTVRGEIVDSTGALVSDFDGTVFPVVYDREMLSSTLANDNAGTEVPFWQQKSVLYRGSHAVTGGRFEYSFIVPRDVSYRYDYAKLSHYAKSGNEDAAGSFLRLKLGGLCDSAYADATAPEVQLFIGDTNFREGGLTGPSPTLLAYFADSMGINVGTGLGHDLTAVVDGNPNSLIVLNDLYEQDIADSRRGSVTYKLQGLPAGRHTVTVKAWNILGLSNATTVSFEVRGSDELVFADLVCAPNPAREVAEITVRVNKPETIASAELQLYNSRGQLIGTHKPNVSNNGYLVGPVRWNVREVPPGLYLARMVVTDKDGETHQVTGKVMVN